MEEDSVFTREAALSADFIPPLLPGRDRHVRELVFCLKPLLRRVRPSHAFLHGRPGTGKTATAKHVLRSLEEESNDVVTVYLNAWQERTRLAVLSRLSVALRLPLPRRGLADDEVLTRIFESLKKSGKGLCVVIDEADRLDEKSRILYDLSRAGEVHGVPCGVVLISNDDELLSHVEDRVRSSLSAKSLQFDPYGPLELKSILHERVKLAFRPGSVEPEAVALCAAMAAKNGGDARFALELLVRAGREADRHGRNVGVTEVKAAASGFSDKPVEVLPEALSGGETRMLEVLKALPGYRKGGVELAFVFEQCLSQHEETDRSLRNHVERLEQRGLIETWEEQGARKVKARTAR
jgi:cell division control protein 6